MPKPADSASRATVVSGGVADVLRAGGDVGRDLLAVDWSATGVGPLAGWPRSLTTAVRILFDGTAVLPRKLRPTPDDEHGRGLQLVASIAERWGTRPLRNGKSVWCMVLLGRSGAGPAR